MTEFIEKLNGTKCWYLDGKPHRVDGPAIEYPDGTKFWCLDDKLHRQDGPAIEYSDGSKVWYQDDNLHRIDGPAAEYVHGRKCWYIDGQEYSEVDYWAKVEEMTLIKTVIDNRTEWRNIEGQLHRINGPAIEYRGSKYWYRDGKLHRVNGPAIEWSDNGKEWYQDGKRHRIDGPAIENSNGSKGWYQDGVVYSEQEYLKLMNKLKYKCNICTKELCSY